MPLCRTLRAASMVTDQRYGMEMVDLRAEAAAAAGTALGTVGITAAAVAPVLTGQVIALIEAETEAAEAMTGEQHHLMPDVLCTCNIHGQLCGLMAPTWLW